MNITDVTGTVTLSNGVKMPYLGLGVYLSENGNEVIGAIQQALANGYRHIDTAALYQNEEGVGQAVNTSGLSRQEIFVTSKVWNSDQGYENTLKAFHRSMEKLKFDYLDLYLVHWPVKDQYKATWRALETLYRDGKVKAIGVSNFMRHQLEDLLQSANIVPMVNQMEFHPRLVQQPLLDFCRTHAIQYEAWSPLMRGRIFDIPELKVLAKKYRKSIAQLVLRWNLQKDVVTIPKSVHPKRITENADLFDFTISTADIRIIDALHTGARTGPDPENFSF